MYTIYTKIKTNIKIGANVNWDWFVKINNLIRKWKLNDNLVSSNIIAYNLI